MFWVQSNATIQEPVVVVTWSFANIPNSNSINELGNSLVNRRILQRYVTSQDPLNGNSTLWFTKHGNAGDYLDGVNLNRSCLNLSLNDQACDEAIAWGVPTVGVPFGFQKTSSDQPYEKRSGCLVAGVHPDRNRRSTCFRETVLQPHGGRGLCRLDDARWRSTVVP